MLGNSTSHGMHLMANGLSWADGDEVIVLAGDYPATVLPWQRLPGVRTVALSPDLTATDLTAAIGPRTRLVAVTWSTRSPVVCPRSRNTTVDDIDRALFRLGSR